MDQLKTQMHVLGPASGLFFFIIDRIITPVNYLKLTGEKSMKLNCITIILHVKI